MTQRKAPKTGYDFGNKRHYRRDIYAPIAKVLRHHRSSAQIMMMPSIEGDEIEVAMSKGFKQKNIHIVDQNSAIVATLKRRYPYVHTYGVEVRRALKRMLDEGVKLDFANFDLCGSARSAFRLFEDLGYESGSSDQPE